jgi:hypothetical protein
MGIGGFVSFGPSGSLYEFVDTYHLLPFVSLFFFLGLVTTVTMAATAGFRCLAEVVDAFYVFKEQCVTSKRRYEKTAGKQPR